MLLVSTWCEGSNRLMNQRYNRYIRAAAAVKPGDFHTREMLWSFLQARANYALGVYHHRMPLVVIPLHGPQNSDHIC